MISEWTSMLFCVHTTILAWVRTILYCFVFCIFIKLGEIHINQKKPTMYIVYSQRIIWVGGIILKDTLIALYEEVTVLNITCQNLNYDPRDYYKEGILFMFTLK